MAMQEGAEAEAEAPMLQEAEEEGFKDKVGTRAAPTNPMAASAVSAACQKVIWDLGFQRRLEK